MEEFHKKLEITLPQLLKEKKELKGKLASNLIPIQKKQKLIRDIFFMNNTYKLKVG